LRKYGFVVTLKLSGRDGVKCGESVHIIR
jgi:hypothetical protein